MTVPTSKVTPLDWRTAIVDPQTGNPNSYFIRLWQTMFGNGQNSDTKVAALEAAALQAGSGIAITPNGHLLSNPAIAAQVQPILDQVSTTQGTILYRGSAAWAALAPGTAGNVLSTNGAAANPSWITPPGGGGGALTKISSFTAVGGESAYTFSSIPVGFDDLVLVFEGRSSSAATYVLLNLTVNGLTTSIYQQQRLINGPGNSNSGDQLTTTSITNLCTLAGANANAGLTAGGVVEFINYSGSIFNKTFLSQARNNNSNTGNSWYIAGIGWIALTAPITSVTLTPAAGTLVAGTKYVLYGRGGTPTIYGAPFEIASVGTGASQNITLPTTGLTAASVNVYVNGVRYPTSEYSISGTSLTMTSNASGDAIAITGYMP